MQTLGWLGEHWTDLLQIAGLFLAVYSLQEETKERRIQNLFTLTAAHRDLWSRLYEKPELDRILNDDVDVNKHPPTAEEELFVHSLILHLATWFKARSLGSDLDDDAVSTDIKQFLSCPIPLAVWNKAKRFQSRDFSAFIDAAVIARSANPRNTDGEKQLPPELLQS